MKRAPVIKPDIVGHVDSFISFTGAAIQTPSKLKKLEKQLKTRTRTKAKSVNSNSQTETKRKN